MGVMVTQTNQKSSTEEFSCMSAVERSSSMVVNDALLFDYTPDPWP